MDDYNEKWEEEYMMRNLGFMPNDIVNRLKRAGVKKDVTSELMISLYVAIAETTNKIWTHRCKKLFEKKSETEEMIIDIP